MDNKDIFDFDAYQTCTLNSLPSDEEIITFIEYEEPSFKEINFLDETE